MNQSDFLLYIIKLILGGAEAFCAILVWTRVRTIVWSLLVCGSLILYAGCVYEILIFVGIIQSEILIANSVSPEVLFFTATPFLCFITAFIIKFIQKN